jgi:hypothetical protein
MGFMILYPTDDGIAVITPLDTNIDINDLALKDVPEGKPFLIIDSKDLPDKDFREAWTADFSQPDGKGLGPEKFQLELLQREKNFQDFKRKKSMVQLSEKAKNASIPEPPKPPRSKRKKVNSNE